MTPKKAKDTVTGLLIAMLILCLPAILSGGAGSAGPVLLCVILALTAAALYVILRWWRCPHCGKGLGHGRPKYCPHCGKRIVT